MAVRPDALHAGQVFHIGDAHVHGARTARVLIHRLGDESACFLRRSRLRHSPADLVKPVAYTNSAGSTHCVLYCVGTVFCWIEQLCYLEVRTSVHLRELCSWTTDEVRHQQHENLSAAIIAPP